MRSYHRQASTSSSSRFASEVSSLSGHDTLTNDARDLSWQHTTLQIHGDGESRVAGNSTHIAMIDHLLHQSLLSDAPLHQAK